ncbi:MAG: tRNA 4-thiouridine(8) synthase ThiI [Spirochaetes bacterium]|nr:tRNA 4-thiouridine(8) synthase ThiI [Spirochaetota bacterium]
MRYSELALKKGNRSYFESVLINNIKNKLKNIIVIKEFGRLYIQKESFSENEIKNLSEIPGIKSFSKIYFCNKNIDDITDFWIKKIEENNLIKDGTSFYFSTKRIDKSFSLHSDEISRFIAKRVLEFFKDKYKNIEARYKNVDITFYTEIRKDFTFIYWEKIEAVGGLPLSTTGKGLALLSGGIDSPVASYLMMKRGMKIDFIHFESPPYTTEKSREKVLNLARELKKFENRAKIFIVPFTKIQVAIRKNCNIEFLTILMRRAMFEISEKIATKFNYDVLITGESLGQVASQTVNSIKVIEDIIKIPVFRPLIGLDKEEIIEYSKKINTFNISILPYEDCCTIFVPKHPKINPLLEEVMDEEKKYKDEKLFEEVLNNIEIIEIR